MCDRECFKPRGSGSWLVLVAMNFVSLLMHLSGLGTCEQGGELRSSYPCIRSECAMVKEERAREDAEDEFFSPTIAWNW